MAAATFSRLFHLAKFSSGSIRRATPFLSARMMSSETSYNFETLNVTTPSEFVKHVEVNRPDKRNAMNTKFFQDMIDCFTRLAVDSDCRVVILSGAGKIFSAGLDLQGNDFLAVMLSDMEVSRKANEVRKNLPHLQEAFNVIEKCNKPVIAAIHSGCVGGGIDMTAACDIRYCTSDAWFTIKEVDIGLAADLGTLQRFPKIIGNDSLCRELVYTARKFEANEAKEIGFVSRIFKDKEEMIAACLELSKTIAAKSPVAVQGSKANLVYSRDHSVKDGLDYMVAWNSAMLQSEDVMKAAMASMQKETAVFSKL